MSRKPWKPNKKDLEDIRERSGRGMTIDQIGASLGVTGKTLWKYMRLEPKDDKGNPNGPIGEAIKGGRAKAITDQTGILWKISHNFKHRGQTPAVIFWLKNVARWSDKHTIQGDEDAPPVKIDLKIKPGRGRGILDLVLRAHAPKSKQKLNRKSTKRPKKKSSKRPKR